MADRLQTLRLDIDPLLTQLASGYSMPEMIMTDVLPLAVMTSMTAKVPDFTGNTEARQILQTKRAIRSRPNRVEFTVGHRTVALEDYALESGVDVLEISEAGVAGIDARAKAAIAAKTGVLVRREYDGATLMQDTGSYAAGHFATVAGGSGWNEVTGTTSNVDPIDVLDTAADVVRAAIGRRPNQLVLGYTAFQAMRRNTNIKARCGVYYGGSPSAIGPAGVNKQVLMGLLQSELDIETLLVGVSNYRSGTSWVDLWGDCAILQFVDKRPDPENGTSTHGYTLCRQWGMSDGQMLLGVAGTYAETGPWVEMAYYEEYYAFDIAMDDAAYLLLDVVK